MHPSTHAAATPDRPAIVMAGSGATLTYAELEARSNRVAQLLRAQGLVRGDTIAIWLDNCLDFLALCWGAQRSGLVFVAMSTKLGAEEAAYIVADSGAQAVFAGARFADLASALPVTEGRYAVGGDIPGWTGLDAALAAQPDTRIADESPGRDMLYSSGTTGRPKGVRGPLPEGAIDAPDSFLGLVGALYGFAPGMIYLSPAPLYHAAPLRYCMAVHRFGGTVIVMEKFDAQAYLALVERHRATHSQLVPTMFVKMLKLPEAVRTGRDLSSLKCAIHAAAPCPVEVKAAMLDWWGDVVFEYYSATEGAGFTAISPQEWRAHPGSVGKSLLGEIRVLGDDDRLLGAHLFRRRADVQLSQRPREDRQCHRRARRDLRRYRARRRRRLSLPHRPRQLHDHLGRRERLSAGGRERPDDAPRSRRRRGVRRAARRTRRDRQGRRPAARPGCGRPSARGRADRLCPRATKPHQMPDFGRF